MIDERFMRTEMLLGSEGLKKLKDATVMVVGLGAVGGYALEALARSGIGHLVLVDFDVFDLSNINRQILALTSTVGQKKTEVAKKRVLDIHPKCKVELEDCFVSIENINKILNRKIDFVVDAIDSIKEKSDMMAALCEKKIKFVSAMGAALKTDVNALKTDFLSHTKYCPMAKKLRKELKNKGLDISKIMCVYSTEQSDSSQKPIKENPTGGKAILGSMPTVTAVMGLMLAHYVILSLAKGDQNAKHA